MLRLFFVSLLAVTAASAAGEFTLDAPMRNWVLPVFTDAGPRSMTARGAEARMNGPRSVLLTDMNLTVFSGLADNKVDSVMLSPIARINLDSYLVSGESTVRVVRDDLEVTGKDWTYDHNLKKVTIRQNARVVFTSELPAILQQ